MPFLCLSLILFFLCSHLLSLALIFSNSPPMSVDQSVSQSHLLLGELLKLLTISTAKTNANVLRSSHSTLTYSFKLPTFQHDTPPYFTSPHFTSQFANLSASLLFKYQKQLVNELTTSTHIGA